MTDRETDRHSFSRQSLLRLHSLRLIFFLGIVPGLGQEFVTLRLFALFTFRLLHLRPDDFGALAFLIRMRIGIDLISRNICIRAGIHTLTLALHRSSTFSLLVILQLTPINIGIHPKAILHSPAIFVSTAFLAHQRLSKGGRGGGSILKPINTIHPLRLLLRVNKTAKRSLELLAARAVSHPPQTGTVPVDFAGFWVERGFLGSLFFEGCLLV